MQPKTNRAFRGSISEYYSLVVVMTAIIVIQSTAVHATLEHEMRGMFNSMVNVTDGGYHKAMGRGVIAGPSVVIRNNRVRTDLINFVPPNIEAGCGGIDMFLGSFSFINGDQFIHLMQAIAANAAGYAFKLALQTMCPSCSDAIDKLQSAIQKMNALAGDSCKVAQHAVDFLADQMGQNELQEKMEKGPLGSIAQAIGEQAGAFSAFLDKINNDTNTQSMTPEEVKEMLGNIAWKVLQKNSYVTSAFISGDDELAEALMSFTGTIIGQKNGDDDYPQIREKPSLLSAEDLLKGGSSNDPKKKYNCDDTTDCLNPTEGSYTFKGLENYVEEVLLGANRDAGTDSMVFKLTTNSGNLTEQEKQLIRISPYHMTRLRNMAVCNFGTGVGSLADYSKKASRLIALEILQKYLQQAVASIYLASQTGTNVGGFNVPYALSPKYVAGLKDIQKQVQAEFTKLQENLSATLEQMYQSATINCNLQPISIKDFGG